MRSLLCDFHIHTVLSPCADLSMSPDILREFLFKYNIKWIAITDHNSSKNVRAYTIYLSKFGIEVIPGMEITTKEEVHILLYFPSVDEAERFSEEIEENIEHVEYDPEKLGYQILVNEEGEFENLYMKKYLGSRTRFSIEEIYEIAKKRDYIFVYAHIFRLNGGIIGVLGFPPSNIIPDAVEVRSIKEKEEAKKLGFKSFLFNSDSHNVDMLGSVYSKVKINETNFSEFKALLKSNSFEYGKK